MNAIYLNLFAIYLTFVVFPTFDPFNAFFAISQKFHIKYILASWIFDVCGMLSYSILSRKNIVSIRPQKNIALFISLFFALFIISLALYYRSLFGPNAIAALHFHILQPMREINFTMVKQVVVLPFIRAITIAVSILTLVSIRINIKFLKLIIKLIAKMFLIMMPVVALVYMVFTIGLPHYLKTLNAPPSNFYETHYIDPSNVKITFPENKRNLIVVFVESLETGFLPLASGGGFPEDLIPEIKQLMEQNISFSNTESYGGSNPVSGTGWTIAGILSQLNGVPITLSIDGNSLGNLSDTFFSGAYGVGDILHANGYSQYLICGADAGFSGKDKYYLTHKNSVIYDYEYFKNNQLIPQNYSVWWGVEDRKLYGFAKELIKQNIENNEPFFLTIETADTHAVGGYLDESAEREYDSQFKNVVRDMSKQLYDFILWLKEQSFYENTTVVVLGDHLYMDGTVFDSNQAERHPINIFINSPLDDTYSKNRQFTSFDIFPLLIESIGGAYTEHGLGLGRSINRNEKSLLEEFGDIQLFNNELVRRSTRYNELWGIETVRP